MIGTKRSFVNLGKMLALFICFAAGQSVWASELSYSYVELEYIADVELDYGDGDKFDGDGFGVAASYEFSERFFVSASYHDGSGDSTLGAKRYSTDLEVLRAGLGMHSQISETLDWVILADYVDLETTVGSISADDDGYIIELGVRGLATDSVEYNVAIVQSDIGGSETGFRVGGRYHFVDSNVSLGAEYVRYATEFDMVEVGLRYQFD